MARFTQLQPDDRIADWYATNEIWGSPNIDSSHRCIYSVDKYQTQSITHTF